MPEDDALVAGPLEISRQSAARLSFGDCATYALAKARGLPLLFKADDFSKTDLVAA